MTGIIKRGTRWIVKGLIMAFLIVAVTQVLLYFNILGDSFPIKVMVTFGSFIVASILLWIVTRPSGT
jgi:Zn-dependent protease with chaperone function